MTQNLSVLEGEGYIRISTGNDHRTRIVEITNKGPNAVTKAIPLWNDVQRTLKQQMSENSWRELMQNPSHEPRRSLLFSKSLYDRNKLGDKVSVTSKFNEVKMTLHDNRFSIRIRD